MKGEEYNRLHPGTVSSVLWHFTGGPRWNERENRQNKSRKPARDAFKILINILNNKCLRLGKYSERIRVSAKTSFMIGETNVWPEKNWPTGGILRSSPVCCLADIPLMHLQYIANRYNKFALGFRRESVIESGFNPVLYTLEGTDIVQQFFRSLTNLDIDGRLWYLFLKKELEKLKTNETKSIYMDSYNTIEKELEKMKNEASLSRQGLEHLLSFVKIFKRNEFHTIYCEREWRSIKEYEFTYDDLSFIVIPKSVNKVQYYDIFCEEYIDELDIPKRLPVVPWEDVIEY